VIPEAFANRLDQLIQTRPLGERNNTSSSSSSGLAPPSSAANQSQQSGGSSSSGIPLSTLSGIGSPGGPVPDFAPTDLERAPNILGNRHALRVLLVVRIGQIHTLSQIQLRARNWTTAQFFGSLRCEYNRLRGHARQLFSVWRFSHCDFYQVCFSPPQTPIQTNHPLVREVRCLCLYSKKERRLPRSQRPRLLL
jgi:hypothetical protein